jgi:predicted DNA-binding transcriptional regulator AlpA
LWRVTIERERFLLRDELPTACRFSRHTMRRMIRDEGFPMPILVSPQRHAWRESEVQAWLESRPRASTQSDQTVSAETRAKLREAWNRRRARRQGRHDGPGAL